MSTSMRSWRLGSLHDHERVDGNYGMSSKAMHVFCTGSTGDLTCYTDSKDIDSRGVLFVKAV